MMELLGGPEAPPQRTSGWELDSLDRPELAEKSKNNRK
jgi:hypothetical protein